MAANLVAHDMYLQARAIHRFFNTRLGRAMMNSKQYNDRLVVEAVKKQDIDTIRAHALFIVIDLEFQTLDTLKELATAYGIPHSRKNKETLIFEIERERKRREQKRHPENSASK